MIQWVVFDIGGVLIPDKKNILISTCAEEWKIKYDDLVSIFKKQNIKLTKGKLKLIRMFSLKLKLNRPKEALGFYINTYLDLTKYRDDKVIELIQQLKEKVNVACLTNTEEEIYKVNEERGLFSYFENKYISTKLHCYKPEIKIYKKIIKDLKCSPSQIILIDDDNNNLLSAKRLGFNCITYNGDINRLKQEIYNIDPDLFISHSGTSENNANLISILSEISNELRSRRQAEYAYTSAVITTFGAMTVGFTVIKNSILGFLAISTIIALSFSVIRKILHEHRVYLSLKDSMLKLTSKLEKFELKKNCVLPNYYKVNYRSIGHIDSMIIVIIAALGTSLFILQTIYSIPKP